MKLPNNIENIDNTNSIYRSAKDTKQDEEDHMILWDMVSPLVPEEMRLELIIACNVVVDHFVKTRDQAVDQADRRARISELDGILNELTQVGPDTDSSVFSSSHREYKVVSDHFRTLTAQQRINQPYPQLRQVA